MNLEIAKKWVAALRSGKYKQTRGKLARTKKDGSKSFCCLGVLTDIYLKENKNSKFCDWSRGMPPEEVEKWAKVNKDPKNYSCPFYYPHKNETGRRNLTNDNDIGKRSFAQIADIIERNAEHL